MSGCVRGGPVRASQVLTQRESLPHCSFLFIYFFVILTARPSCLLVLNHDFFFSPFLPSSPLSLLPSSPPPSPPPSLPPLSFPPPASFSPLSSSLSLLYHKMSECPHDKVQDECLGGAAWRSLAGLPGLSASSICEAFPRPPLPQHSRSLRDPP